MFTEGRLIGGMHSFFLADKFGGRVVDTLGLGEDEKPKEMPLIALSSNDRKEILRQVLPVRLAVMSTINPVFYVENEIYF